MQLNGREVTLDDLQNGYFIYQSADGFRFGVDAVLLSGFVSVKVQETVLDLGTGTGIIPILLAAKTPGRQFTGLEIQKESAELARESVRFNRLEDRISIVEGDIKEASRIFGSESMNVVVSNPPYMIAAHGLRASGDARYIARHEVRCTFEDVAREAARMLKSRGRMYLIHRPSRLAELFSTLKKYALEPKRIRFIHPYVDKEPSMVMIEALKGGNSGMRVEPPLIIYEKDGSYTKEIHLIYGK